MTGTCNERILTGVTFAKHVILLGILFLRNFEIGSREAMKDDACDAHTYFAK
jgi:hypothetical protein